MTAKVRSPFGSMVRHARQERGWTQARLALEVAQHLPATDTRRGFTERTIGAFERAAPSPADWVRPRATNVHAIAAAFGFAPASELHQDLLAAAVTTRRQADAAASPATTPSWQPPFVAAGRDRYLARMMERASAAIGGSPQVLMISADAGTGKTSLLLEAGRQISRQHPQVAILWGDSGARLGTPQPYLPFRHLLREMVGDDRAVGSHHLVSEANRQQIASRVPIALAALQHHGLGLIHRVLPVSALDNTLVKEMNQQSLIVPLKAQPIAQQRADPAESLLDVIGGYAAAGPLVLVLDDLHASDAHSIRFLTALVHHLSTTSLPILVLASSRPSQDIEKSNPPLADLLRALEEAPHAVLDLNESLQVDAAQAFIDAYAASLGLKLTPAETAEVREQTLGLPIHVEGVLHQLQAGRTDSTVPDTALPFSHGRLFDTELGSLPPATRKALVAASVQGETFSLDILSKVMGTPVHDLAAQLNDTPLRRRGMVQPAGESSPDASEFQFTHTLMRDHLYYTCLSDFERAHLHALTAEALTSAEREDRGTWLGQVAYHLEHAGEHGRAATTWLQTADTLVSLYEFERAWFAFERILAQGNRPGKPALDAEAMLGISVCARALDQRHEAESWASRGLEFVRRRHLPAIEARLLSHIGMLAYDAGDVDRGSKLLRESIVLHEQSGDLAEAARSLTRLSHNLHGLGRYDEAIREAERSIELATHIGRKDQQLGGQIALANCWLDMGRFDAAIDLYASTLSASTAMGDIHRANVCLINMALCHIEQHAWEPAAEALAPFLNPGRPVVPRFMGTVEYQFGLIAAGKGQFARARQHFQASLRVRQQNGQEALVIDSLAGLLRVACQSQDPVTAGQLLSDIDARLTRRGLDGIEHVARLVIAMIEGGRITGDWPTMHLRAEQGVAFLMRRAGAMAHASDRARYLENIPTHRRLVALAMALDRPDLPIATVPMASD